jgi:hypothetical protein
MASTLTPDEQERIKAAAWHYADQTHLADSTVPVGKTQFPNSALTGTTNLKLQVIAGET